MPASLQQQTARLECWFKDHALPLWAGRGINAATGASYERLLPSGEVDSHSNIRVRVQARQAYVFAVAAQLGWCKKGQKIAARLLGFARERAVHPSAENGFTHLLDANFSVIDKRQDLYDHAFFLLAFAWQYRAFGEREALTQATQLVAYLDASFGADYGGWIEGDYDYSYRRQNPHMHLLEAFMALFEASGDACWLARAGQVFSLFETRFYCPKKGVLLEFFSYDWTPAPDAVGQVVEPGHMLEWVWLLDWYGRLSGQSVARYTRVLYAQALAIGISPAGLPYDSVTAAGEILQYTQRCWGLTELIKASLVMARSGDSEAKKRAEQGLEALFDNYLCVASTPGSYIDQRGEHNEVVTSSAPASTLYHLMALMRELLMHKDAML